MRDLYKSYMSPQGRHPVLTGINLSLPAGESLALMGESGSGKSTLLHLIGALDEADQGDILLDGVHITTLNENQQSLLRRQTIGFVFQ